MEEMERNKENYSDSRYQNEMLRLEVRALQLEYLLENDIVLDHSNISQSDPTRGRTKGDYLDNSDFNLLYLFALIAVFCTFAVTKEYATKQSLSLFTSPAKRTQIYFAKTALNVLFAFAAVTVYFLITACVITRYPQYEPIVFRYGKEFVSYSAAQAMMLYYCFTLLVAAFSAIFTTTVAFFCKNIYLGVALSVLCLVGIPWILLNWNGDANIAKFFPFQNFFFCKSQASFSRTLFVMNTPIIAAASFTISSLLLMAVGILGVNRMQHKE